MSSDGSFIDVSPFFLGYASWYSSVWAVSNGETALITWSEGLEIRGALFSPGNGYRELPVIASSAESLVGATSVGTDGENYLVAFSCHSDCHEGAPRSGVYQPRIWSIEIDGVSGLPVEVPQPLSRLLTFNGGIAGGAAIGHGSDWWALRTEASDLYIGEERVFEAADQPTMARDASLLVVAARRGREVVFRLGR